MFGETARDWLCFCLFVLAGGIGLAPRRASYSRFEAWCVGVGWAVAVLGAVVCLVHWLQLPLRWIALGPLALVVGLVWRWRRVADFVADATVRGAFLTWSWLVLGCLAFLACVFSYSGGTWMGDWEEHFHRPLMLLRLRPEDGFFPGFAFTSRPPLANAAEAALLWLTDASFARHQVFLLLLNSLAALPIALWAGTCGGGRAAAAGAGFLLLLNPLFLQNTTYAWTKLITAFFVLTGLHVLLVRGYERHRAITGFALLGFGVLCHYSAGVWLLTFGAGWLFAQRARWRESEFRVTVLQALGAGVAILGPWLVFAVTHYGITATLTSNPSVATGAQFTWIENLLSSGPKLWNSLIPHPLRTFDGSMLQQTNGWTWFRDQVFLVYQANLFAGVGSASLVLAAAVLVKPGWQLVPPLPRLWWVIGMLTVFLGTAVHGDVDRWGMAHVCLQPMMLLGVAVAAARLPRLWPGRPSLLFGAAAGLALLDLLLGILLHYSAAALQLNRPPGQSLLDYVTGISPVALHNLARKIHYGQEYFMDRIDLPWWTSLTIGVAVIVLCGLRARRLALAPSAPP